MGKIIKIGVLCVTYSLLVMKSQPLLGQNATKNVKDTIRDLEELIISSERSTSFQPLVRVVAVIQQQEIERAAVRNLPDLLRYLQGTDLRSRGGEGVQADLSIMGGTFDQTMVMINGINFTDPQTGHHSLNIPVEISQIERVEILQGPGAWSEGSVAYAGAINIITKRPEKLSADVSVSGGSYGFFKGEATLGFASRGRWKVSGIGGGGYSSSGGYTSNTDFNITNLYSNISLVRKTGSREHTITLQAGYQHKAFGANSFYTIAYPEQFEETRLFLSSLQYQYQSGRWQIKASAYQRRFFDRFELFRYEAPSWYKGHNYHQNDIAGINVQVAYKWGLMGTSIAGADYRLEHIFSTVLGDAIPATGTAGENKSDLRPVPFENGKLFTKAKSRHTPGIYIKHIVQLERWRLTGGLLLSNSYNSAAGTPAAESVSGSYGIRLYAGISAAYKITPYLEANGWANNSYRNPTFTDLYYKSPTQTGNTELKPEEAIAAQMGLRLTKMSVRASLSGFHRYGYRIIDWTRASGSDQWQASNITNIASAGGEVNISYISPYGSFEKARSDSKRNSVRGNGSFLNSAGISYAYLTVSKESENLHSLYATDFLRHKASAFIDHKIVSRLSARWDVSFQKRDGTYLGPGNIETSYKPFVLVDVRLLWSAKKYKISVEATNLFNTNYLYIGNLPQPGRWIKAGFSFSL